MPTNVTIQLSNTLLSAVLARAIEAEKDLPDLIVGILSDAVLSASEAPHATTPEEIAEVLYSGIVEENRAATLAMAWKRKFGKGWKELDGSQRVLIGLRFKELIEDIAAGKRQPPGGTTVRLVRFGQLPQGQALYTNIVTLDPQYTAES